MSELKINKGIELMLRRAKPKEEVSEDKPEGSHGFSSKKYFTLLKRRVYFNLEFWWDKET